MPFITEEIYLALVPEEESLMMSSWPVYKEEWNFPADENVMEHIKAITKGIRNVRAEMDVPNSRKTKVYVVCQDEALCNGIEGKRELRTMQYRLSYQMQLYIFRWKIWLILSRSLRD